ncbi:hypothetical protein [Microvirga brassicacearum]|uniref:hypothetical protein n=1 Tax=Microvirga brassicacearum TaxID=2580413 RepID=UPI0012930B7E|nr:hypothetical protein [Microvirga brassicacearum]
MRRNWPQNGFSAGLAFASLAMTLGAPAVAQTISLMPASMPKIGTVDERYQS